MKAMKQILLITMTLSSIASAESTAAGGNDFGQQVKAGSAQEEKEPVAFEEPCSGNNMEIQIEDYDVKTGTFEIVDTKCDGQGPWYSTMEVVGCAVPTLWMKTDPRLFVGKTVMLKKNIEFHPVREDAREEANKFNPKTCKQHSGIGGFFKKLLRSGSNGR